MGSVLALSGAFAPALPKGEVDANAVSRRRGRARLRRTHPFSLAALASSPKGAPELPQSKPAGFASSLWEGALTLSVIATRCQLPRRGSQAVTFVAEVLGAMRNCIATSKGSPLGELASAARLKGCRQNKFSLSNVSFCIFFALRYKVSRTFLIFHRNVMTFFVKSGILYLAGTVGPQPLPRT